MITASIFAQKDYVAKDGHVPIKLRLTVHRKVYPPIRLDKRTRLDDWDDDRSRVKATHPNAHLLNTYLGKVQAQADAVILKHDLTGRPLSYESFVREMAGQSPYDFFQLCSDFLQSKKTSSWGYREKIRHTVEKLKQYRFPLELHQVTYSLVLQYIDHLKATRGNCQNTINTNVNIFRRVCRHGIKLKLTTENPFLEYRTVAIKTNRATLTLDEVRKLHELLRFNLPYYLRSALTWFLLALHTGRRYGDLKGFAEWKINGEYISILQDKGIFGRDEKKVIIIYLNDVIRQMIQLIKVHGYTLASNQKANDYIKEVIELAGIDKHISFHCARHTFAAINKKLTDDLTVRRDLLGHDSINSTLIYDHVDEDILKATMNKWNGLNLTATSTG